MDRLIVVIFLIKGYNVRNYLGIYKISCKHALSIVIGA